MRISEGGRQGDSPTVIEQAGVEGGADENGVAAAYRFADLDENEISYAQFVNMQKCKCGSQCPANLPSIVAFRAEIPSPYFDADDVWKWMPCDVCDQPFHNDVRHDFASMEEAWDAIANPGALQPWPNSTVDREA